MDLKRPLEQQVSPQVKRRRTCCQQEGCTTRAKGDRKGGKAIKREKVWVPTDAFLPCMDHVSKIVAPWIVAGEFPEAFNQIGMHTDVV